MVYLVYMPKGFESFEERLEKNALEQQDRRVLQLLRELDSSVDGGFDSYVTVNFTDSSGRSAEIRVLRAGDDEMAYQLNANVGAPLAMIELFERLRAEGIPVNRMVAIRASKKENEQLKRVVEEAQRF